MVQEEGLTSYSTFAHSPFTTCNDDDLLDASYFRFLGRCSSSGDGRRRVRVAFWDTLWTVVVSGCWRGLGGRTSGFSWERTRAETCRVLCGWRSGRREARGRRGRCIMVEWGDVYKSHSSKIPLGTNKNNPQPCASFPNHLSTAASPSPSKTPCSPSDTLSTPSLPACTLPAPATHSLQSHIHGLTVPSPHTHLRIALPRIHKFAYPQLASCIHVTRPHKTSLHIPWNDSTPPGKHG